MRTNIRALIREARELLSTLPHDSAVAADLDCIVMGYDEGGTVDAAELLVAVADAHEELRHFRESLAA